MSPALVDAGTPAHRNPRIIEGEVFLSNLALSSLDISGLIANDRKVSFFDTNPYKKSGFHNSGEMNPNFEFSSSASTIDKEKPMFSSSSGLSRPRMGKSRKSVNRSMGSSEIRNYDLAFNPFRSVLDGLSGVSSRVESDKLLDKNINLKVINEVDDTGNALVDEIRRLKIESRNADDMNERVSGSLSGIQQHSKGVDSSLPPELPDGLGKLSLGGSKDESSKISRIVEDDRGGIHESKLGSGVGHNVGGLSNAKLVSDLPNDLQKLNLKDYPREGSSHTFSFASTAHKDHVFGSSRKSNDTVDPNVTNTFPDKIKNLNVDDFDKRDGAPNELNVNKSGHPMILDEIEKLKIGDCSDVSRDNISRDTLATLRKEPHESLSKEGGDKSNHPDFTSLFNESCKHCSGPQILKDKSDNYSVLHQSSVSPMPSIPPSCINFQSDGAQKEPGLGVPPVEFGSPDPKENLFAASNRKINFSANKGSNKDNLSRGRKGKAKEPHPVLSFWKNFTLKENNVQDNSHPSDSLSPMDISPCRDMEDDEQSPAETSLMSDDQTSTASPVDEDLIRATECMDINKEHDVNHDEVDVQVAESDVRSCEAMTGSLESSPSVVESKSFNSAFENLSTNEENEVESSGDSQSSHSQYLSASSSLSSGGLSFIFAASSSAQGQASASMRHHRKKTRMKGCSEIYIPTRNALLSDATSPSILSPIPRAAGISSPVGQKDVLSTGLQKEGDDLKVISHRSKISPGSNLEVIKRETTSSKTASRAAQEACENWRLRGNQAYSSGNLGTAEDYYTQGLSCIPQNETSGDCLRAMVLCYSNRAATRMSLGRVRDALQDCLVASKIDPNFFRVQLRAANCYLALGEVGDALRYFKKLLHSNDVCVERKLITEASDGIQKAQKVAECMDRSTELLQRRTLADVESAMGVISDALVLSPYSELLLERKATALFMLRRYEEVIQLCEQTMEAAEKNSPVSDANEHSSDLEAAKLLRDCFFRIWRYSHIFKSNFYLGKLEEALDFLEKQEQWKSMVIKHGSGRLESLLPQVLTVRELIRHKSAGNEAFQAGRLTEAVEHYTTALSFNVESRPFAAVCFGNRAAAYQAMGQITDAIADCSLAIALDGSYLKAISRRASLFEMIRDYEQAAKDLQRLVCLLMTQVEGKVNQSGASLSINSVAELRHARQRLGQMEEQARKGLPKNFYLILGVEASVAAADLKKAYRKAALKHHPDKAGQLLARSESGDDGLWKEIAEEVYKDADRLFKMIGEAYAVLSDPCKRSQYDIEEEARNGLRKSGIGGVSRMYTDAPFYSAERSGGSGRWREMGKSSANPYSRGFEPTRPSRFY